MKIERDDARQRLLATGTGNITVDEVRSVVEYQHRKGLWHYGLLYDFRGAKTVMTGDDARSLAHYTEQLHAAARGPVAVVAVEPAFYGIARMYEMLTDAAGLRFAVFHTLAEAEEWLNQQQQRR